MYFYKCFNKKVKIKNSLKIKKNNKNKIIKIFIYFKVSINKYNKLKQ